MMDYGLFKGMFRLNSLRFRVLLLVLLAVLPVICALVYAGWHHKEEDIADIRNDILTLVRFAARDQEEIITKSTPPLLHLLASLYPEVQSKDSVRTSRLFARILEEYPQYINIMAAEVPSGHVFASGLPLSKPLNVADRSYFEPLIKNRSYTVGEYALGKATGRPTLVCGYPVIGPDGTVRSIIVAGVDLGRLAQSVADFKMEKDMVITLLDRKGTVLFRTTGNEAWVGKDISGSAIWAFIQKQNDEGSYRGVDYDGGRKLAAFKSLIGANGKGEAYLVAGIDEAVAVAGTARFMRGVIVSIVVSTLLALVGAMVVGYRYVVVKVDSLVRTATRLADGDLDARTGIKGGTEEFARLADSFDTMAHKLRQREESQKLAEQALAEEKELLMVTLRSIGDGVITTDSHGNIVLLNSMAEHLTGWAMLDAKGQPLEEVFHIINEKSRERCRNPVEMVLESGSIIELANHTVLIARDGRELVIADSGAPIVDNAGFIIGVVLVFRDITEKQRLEEEFIKSERLESLALLAGGIAHDFNNLLSAILGNISLARLNVQTDTVTAEKLTKAEQATLQARGLTTQLLSFTKGGAFSKKCMNIEALLRSTAKFVLSGSKARCEFRFTSDLWPVEIDEGQFTQVINNLILNAVQSMQSAGTISIGAENCLVSRGTIAGLNENRYVKISISDQGEGIAGENLEKIFDPYFTTKQGGTGLGLASSFYIVRRHTGCITVDSTPGAGTTFNIYLPASSGKVHLEETKTPAFVGKGRILVMEDEVMVRDVVKSMLEHIGLEVDATADGEEALSMYREAREAGRPYAAVIMDLTIPGAMGGKEAVTELLRIDPNARVIASSGYSNDTIMADYRNYGFCGVIPKPYIFAEMQKVLAEVLGDG